MECKKKDEELENISPFPAITGVDVKKGIAMTGGTTAGYRQVLSMFYKDAKERLQLLRFFLFESTMGGNKLPGKHLSSFTTQVLALKSASASLGAVEISEEANRLEGAGKAGERTFIYENLDGFIEHLAELTENIRNALMLQPEGTGAKACEQEPEDADLSVYLPFFSELREALKYKNTGNIDRILDEFSEKPVDSKTKKMLEQISDQVLMAEFESAVKFLDEMVNKSD